MTKEKHTKPELTSHWPWLSFMFLRIMYCFSSSPYSLLKMLNLTIHAMNQTMYTTILYGNNTSWIHKMSVIFGFWYPPLNMKKGNHVCAACQMYNCCTLRPHSHRTLWCCLQPVNTPTYCSVFHNLRARVARCSASCVNGAQTKYTSGFTYRMSIFSSTIFFKTFSSSSLISS